MLTIEEIQAHCNDEQIVLTQHLLSRMRERGIRYEDIKLAITSGCIIKQYPEDHPFPSCLISGNGLHLVCSLGDEMLYIITTYKPSPKIWENDLKTRRPKT
jgi:hypothetical protein